MIESENLRTASLYINNQLLSRGLLRDGHSIDFAHPGDSHGDVADTMSHIMAVVNDLILRRDRDAEHRESLSATLRTLRAESLRQANDIQRLHEKNAEAQRKVGLGEAAETALRTHLKTADAAVHRLKEEAARTKSLVAQTRAACANEVRKRDRQIEGLKKAVTEAGRARGAGKGSGVTTITVMGDVGSDVGGEVANGGVVNEGYDLRMETNAFLAELAKGLSGENETLLQLVRRTMEHLKEMSGWDAADGVLTETGDGHALALAASPTDMAAEVEAVLEHLRTILTNPSFVPIEEVVVRENEIHRLRDGWEKMETRWKEAVHLIDGWRKRMQANGRPINVEELKMGLRLSPVKVNNVEETAHGFGLRLEAVPEDVEDVDIVRLLREEGLDRAPEPETADAEDSDASSVFDHDLNVDELDMEEPNIEILQQSVMLSSPPLPQPPQFSPLRDSYAAGNRGERANRRRHPRDFNTITEENTRDIQPEEAPLPPAPSPKRTQQPPQKRPILSLRPVPPEEAAGVALPPSAIVSTPDTSVDSIPLIRLVDKHTSKPASTSTTSTRSQKRPAPPSRKQSREDPKPTSKPPVKPRPTRPTPANTSRGRSQTRKDERGEPQKTSKPSTRATSATSATSSRSTAAANKSATAASKTTNNSSATKSMPPPPTPAPAPAPAPAQTPGRSPKRVNSRLPLPRTGCTGVPPGPQQSPALTMESIAAKLAASEKDADAARVRAKLKAARLNKGGVSFPPPVGGVTGSGTSTSSRGAVGTEGEGEGSYVSGSGSGVGVLSTRSDGEGMVGGGGSMKDARDEDDELGLSPPLQLQQQQQQQQQVRVAQSPAKAQKQQQNGVPDPEKKVATRKRERRASTKVASRRRSTLSPWELDALIQGGTVTVER